MYRFTGKKCWRCLQLDAFGRFGAHGAPYGHDPFSGKLASLWQTAVGS